jgi:hypothetical protein
MQSEFIVDGLDRSLMQRVTVPSYSRIPSPLENLGLKTPHMRENMTLSESGLFC